MKDPAGLATAAAAAAIPASLTVAAGPGAALAGVAGFAVGLSMTATRAFLAQRDAVREATKAQLYIPRRRKQKNGFGVFPVNESSRF